MKITIDVDITPGELRRFLGLPNVEGLQEEMLKMAQQQLSESGQKALNDMISGAVQPMLAYQQWLQRIMLGQGTDGSSDDKSDHDGKKK